MPERNISTPTEARAGSKEGVVRYVLGISLALSIIAIAIVYFVVV
ncbi:MAG TPA: hypothetical protein VFW46_21850 [Stellaceae bacterium]|jgi:hypothetical protein|nr:hypothetical protein [Stellaceae bacterium]